MVLHITNDYSGSTVYKNLVGELDNLGIKQVVYTPVKSVANIGKNRICLKTDGSDIIYSHILNKTTDRLLYGAKVRKICKDIETKVDLSKVSFIHAHTWFSDGGAAYLLSKKYNIPFIIAIRNTDLNIHHKFFLHYRSFGRKILNHAKDIILIGEYQRSFFSNYNKIDNIIKSKLRVIPNGVSSFWIENSQPFKSQGSIRKYKILYVGTFIKRKKLFELQQAVIEIFTKQNVICELNIVGNHGKQTRKIFRKIKAYRNLFKYHGRVENNNALKKIFRDCHFFAMPSRNETFGLVYVEAMLQGLPILYTANEGIDGFYQEKIGEKVSKKADVLEIQNALLTMIENYASYEIPTAKLLENHNWKRIALTYQKLYQQ